MIDRNEASVAVDGYISAWLDGDVERQTSFMSDDFTWWSNRYNVELARGKAISHLDKRAEKVSNLRLHDVRRHFAPFGIVQLQEISFDAAGEHFDAVPLLLVFHTDGEKVLRCREYLDSTGLPELVRPDGDERGWRPVPTADGAAKSDPIIAAETWNRHWKARDLENMASVAADDFIQWHATVRKNLTKEEEFAMLNQAMEVMQFAFKDVVLTELDGDCVFQECLGDISITGAGSREDVPFAIVYRTRGNKIIRCDEYMDGMSLPPIDFTPKD